MTEICGTTGERKQEANLLPCHRCDLNLLIKEQKYNNDYFVVCSRCFKLVNDLNFFGERHAKDCYPIGLYFLCKNCQSECHI